MTGLPGLACVEEQALLEACGPDSGPDSGLARPGSHGGSPASWAAVPQVTHHNEFKAQQAERIVAIRSGQVPLRARASDDHDLAVLGGPTSAPRPGSNQ